MANMPTILILGKEGQVGEALREVLAPATRLVVPGRDVLDLEAPDTIRATLRAVRPDVILNAAAYTAVDRAESEPERAFRINAEAPGILAEEARRLDALLVHYSTDYVFDGSAREPYPEEAPAHPLGVYGASKRAGEEAVMAAGGRFLILRTSWVYGLRRKNFLTTMLRLARERDEIRVVDDQTGCPTWCRALAEATARILREPLAGREGIYHLAAAGTTTWYGFATALIDRAYHLGVLPERTARCRVVPIPTSAYPTPARRPAYSVLSCEKAARTFGIRMEAWETQLRRCLDAARPAVPTSPAPRARADETLT